jgi:hypothetical protein
MYIKNITQKDVKLNSFEGYKFSIPPGVSWVWDKAGAQFLIAYGDPRLYSESALEKNKPLVDKFGLSNGNGVAPVAEANEKEWIKGGKRMAQVDRFIVNYAQIPKKEQLILIAQKRGVPKEKIQEFIADINLDRSEIANAINELPVPEDIRFPQFNEQIQATV